MFCYSQLLPKLTVDSPLLGLLTNIHFQPLKSTFPQMTTRGVQVLFDVTSQTEGNKGSSN